MRFFGFTLAEVLITLTIIGVIAAITIPNLMQSWRKHELITQIKTAYSIIQNAVKMSIAENGDMPAPDDSNDYTFEIVNTYILPQLKVVKNCKMRTLYEYGCKYGCDIGCFGSKTSGSNGVVYSTLGDKTLNMSWNYTIKLANGMDMGFIKVGPRLAVLVDVNGTKGPSRLGVDVHGFTYDAKNKKWLTGSDYIMFSQPNLTAKNIYNLGYCPDTIPSNTATGACTRILELNGWDFPDDYPVKKF